MGEFVRMHQTTDDALQYWLDHASSAEERAEIAIAGKSGDDSFLAELHFGTGGLRAKLGMGPNRMNIHTVGKASQGLANYLVAHFDSPSVVICRDSRHGSEEFSRRAAEVLAANGVRVAFFPRIEPTPVLSYCVPHLGCSAGVVITASHNPAEYNGYKVYGSDGGQITVDAAREIQAAIDATDAFDDVRILPFEEVREKGLISLMSDGVVEDYCKAVLGQSAGVDCSGIRAVYTPLHGTGTECASRVFRGIGLTDIHLVPEQTKPDGDFPTCPRPNPEDPEALELGIALGEELKADVLLATDPDADRAGVAISHEGGWRRLDGNQVGLLLLDFIARRVRAAGGDLSRRVACTTIASSPMADDIARDYGFELRRTLTGFKFIGEQIGLLEEEGRAKDFLLGFEESYGYLVGTYVRDKDGVLACMLVSEMVAAYKAEGLDLWQAMERLYQRYGYWCDRQISVTYEGEQDQARMSKIMDHLRETRPKEFAGMATEEVVDYANGVSMPIVGGRPTQQVLPPSNVLEFRLNGGSRVILRPSGTEPKLKAYVFAHAATNQETKELLEALSGSLRRRL